MDSAPAITPFPPAPEDGRTTPSRGRLSAAKKAAAKSAKKAPKANGTAVAETQLELGETLANKKRAVRKVAAKPAAGKRATKTAKEAPSAPSPEIAPAPPVAVRPAAPASAPEPAPVASAPEMAARPAPTPAVTLAPPAPSSAVESTPAPVTRVEQPAPVVKVEQPATVAPAPAPTAPVAPVVAHAPAPHAQQTHQARPHPAPAGREGQSFREGQQQHGQPPHQRDRERDHHKEGRHHRRDRHFRDRGDREHRNDRDRDHHAQQDRDQESSREAFQERPLGPPEATEGILELTPKGYGFLRQKARQWAPLPQDPWVAPELVRKIGLREGMWIKGVARMGHRGPQVTEIQEVMGRDPESIRNLPLFEELKAINPNKRIQLETRPERLTTRVMDLMTPVGRGQRGLIVAPPRAGKTTLIEHIAEAVIQNHSQMHLMLLLVDERPEEVTEFRRALPTAEIHASSNDSDVKSHLRTAIFAIERAKRLVECGQHVFILLDSITRMSRAFNNAQKGGAVMSGGVGVGALEMPRRLFAAARNTRDAGSLTILATALIETNSKMDELIFQEFKGTGNLELVLDRKIAEQYIYPAVNIFRSGTRREELLLPAFQMEKVHMLRRGLAGHKPMEAIQRVISLMERYPNNSQMLVELPGKVS